ncbi:MAG: Rieske (2Fe-2S) protein [Hyphomicrobiales bacterium]|nr:MAG: Rieske (2Fe-2S) protein [Hyphomicrobiales bacterium]
MSASPATPSSTRGHYVVARKEDIPVGSRIIVEIKGRSVGVFNVDGKFRAVMNVCPHQGAPLCHGPLVPEISSEKPGDVRFDGGRNFLQCPWHRWEFDLETGESWFDPRTRARPIGVEVEHGADLAPEQTGTCTVLRESTVPGAVHGTVLPTERFPGPFQAELVEVSVEHDYVVLHFGR